MFSCKICKKEYKTQCAVNAHQIVHKNIEQRTQKTKETYIKKKEKRISLYMQFPSKCDLCKINLPYEKRKNRFCSPVCAAKVTNANRVYDPSKDKRTKIVKCRECQTNIVVDFRCRENILCTLCKKKKKNKKEGNCCICGNIIYGNKKTCSDICKNYLISQKVSQSILQRGTTNFSTKKENFSYKYVKNILCDSVLEMAGIIYLIDVFKADKIERYKNILHFWEDTAHRTYNPDFFVIKNNEVYIIEVKMRWSKTSTHKYNRNIPLKKEILQKYCDSKNYKMIWLDFDYDKKLKVIYNKLINNKK